MSADRQPTHPASERSSEMKLLQINKEIPRVFSHSICRKCGGKCCQSYPGATTPEQFGAPDRSKLVARLTTAFASGKYQVDYWEGEARGYFVRPAVRGDDRIKSPTWGGECVFLSSSGCVLRPANRPSECTALEPGPEGDGCHSKAGGKKAYADRWEPYWDEIDLAMEAVEARP